MKPRSIVFDLFGDYVRWDGGSAPLQALSDLLSDFGVPETTARVVMSRLRREGWLETRRAGRAATYALNDRSWTLLTEGRRRIFERERGPWDQQWRLVIYAVPEKDRPARDRVRKTLSWLGFGPLAAATWVSPHDRLEQAAAQLAAEPSARVDLLVARSRGPAADQEMARRCWDLPALQAEFHAQREAYRGRLDAYRKDPPRGRAALVERVRLVHDYRLLPFRDPDLPLELLPEGWVGREVHELFLAAYELLGPQAQAHYRATMDRAGVSSG
jgi:phenylacetic acid degradation operon negative regulatory protein